MTNHSFVPSSLEEITSERIASSLARPPALRITCASPSDRPAYFDGCRRASMQVRIANRRAGGSASLPFSPKPAAYFSFAARTSFRTLLIFGSPVEKSRFVGKTMPAQRTNVYKDMKKPMDRVLAAGAAGGEFDPHIYIPSSYFTSTFNLRSLSPDS